MVRSPDIIEELGVGTLLSSQLPATTSTLSKKLMFLEAACCTTADNNNNKENEQGDDSTSNIHTLHIYPGVNEFFDTSKIRDLNTTNDDDEDDDDVKRIHYLKRSSNDVVNFLCGGGNNNNNNAGELKKLLIGNVEICQKTVDVSNLLVAAAGNQSLLLHSLELEYVEFGIIDFSRMMKNCTSLRKLSLSWIYHVKNANNQSWDELAMVFRSPSCHQLERVIVDQCYATQLYSAVIAGLQNHENLKELCCEYGFDDMPEQYWWERDGCTKDLIRIAQCLRTCPSLEKLCVSYGYDQNSNQHIASIKPLVVGLVSTSSLKELELGRFEMTRNDAILFATFLASNKSCSITKLSLSGCFANYSHSRIVLDGLLRNTSITDVAITPVSFPSIDFIHRLLRQNQNLSRLRLLGHGWDDTINDASVVVDDAFTDNHPSLRILILKKCFTKPNMGMAKLLSWLGEPGCIVEEVDLSNSFVGHCEMEALVELTKKTKGPLRKLRMEHSSLSADLELSKFRTLLEDALKCNPIGLFEVKITTKVNQSWADVVSATNYYCKRNRWNVLSKSIDEGSILPLTAHSIASLSGPDPSLIFNALRGPTLLPALLLQRSSFSSKTTTSNLKNKGQHQEVSNATNDDVIVEVQEPDGAEAIISVSFGVVEVFPVVLAGLFLFGLGWHVCK